MQLLVAADDRTGAFETAAALADAGAGDVEVVVWSNSGAEESVGVSPVAEVVVVDLGSRHLSPCDAATRAASIDGTTGVGRHAHKVDSTLRGNWADELAARAASTGVLLVPALPGLGRTCVGGIVLEHGRPVHEGAAGNDVRRPVLTSRPLHSLRAAGARSVVELSDVAMVVAWLQRPEGVAVADAADNRTIDAILAAWHAAPPVLLAGTSAVIGRAVAVATRVMRPAWAPVDRPILVACGSVHPAARAQLVVTERHGITVTSMVDDGTALALAATKALVLTTPIPSDDVDEQQATAAASTLARGVGDLAAQVPIGAIVILGGDTAAAVIGDAHTVVHGSIEPGTAWATVDGFAVPIVTRAGAFGDERALIDLIERLHRVGMS